MSLGVYIGIPTYDGKLHWTTMSGLVNVARFCGEKHLSICVDVIPGDAFVGKARDTIAARFLKTDFDDLIFIDADIGFNLAGFSALMTAPADADIVMGMYRVKDDKLRFPGLMHDPLVRHPDTMRLIKMQNGPAGFMRVKRRVFEAMAEKWPEEKYHYGELTIHNFFPCGLFRQSVGDKPIFKGEDISFCERAIECGFDIWGVQDIQLDHTGPKTFEANWKIDYLEPVKQEAA
jgi:glycosyltransferase involved in cell wall biosynthesis